MIGLSLAATFEHHKKRKSSFFCVCTIRGHVQHKLWYFAHVFLSVIALDVGFPSQCWGSRQGLVVNAPIQQPKQQHTNKSKTWYRDIFLSLTNTQCKQAFKFFSNIVLSVICTPHVVLCAHSHANGHNYGTRSKWFKLNGLLWINDILPNIWFKS